MGINFSVASGAGDGGGAGGATEPSKLMMISQRIMMQDPTKIQRVVTQETMMLLY